jgi:hypothetical protein
MKNSIFSLIGYLFTTFYFALSIILVYILIIKGDFFVCSFSRNIKKYFSKFFTKRTSVTLFIFTTLKSCLHYS